MRIDEMLDEALLNAKIEEEILDPIGIIAATAKLTRDEANRAVQAVISYQIAVSSAINEAASERYDIPVNEEEYVDYCKRRKRLIEFPLEKVLSLHSTYTETIQGLFSEVVLMSAKKTFAAWRMKVKGTLQIDMQQVIKRENAIEICKGCPMSLRCVAESLSTPEVCLGYEGWGDKNNHYDGQHQFVANRQRLDVTPERLTKNYLVAKRPGDPVSMKVPIQGIII